jgi:DMSO/TMAO reductase YedYZ heme-binding membrane subunit
VRLLLAISLAIAAMCAAIVAATGGGAEAAHAVVRWTARTSLILFALAYVARPAVQLVPSPTTKWLLANRKWLGLGFASSHAAHLAGIVAIAWPDPGRFVRAQDPTIVVAVIAYVVLFAMAFTSIERVKRAMSKRAWTALHRTGMHLFWIVFAFSYVGRVAVAPIYAIPVVGLVAIAALRFAALLRARRRTAARRAVAA